MVCYLPGQRFVPCTNQDRMWVRRKTLVADRLKSNERN